MSAIISNITPTKGHRMEPSSKTVIYVTGIDDDQRNSPYHASDGFLTNFALWGKEKSIPLARIQKAEVEQITLELELLMAGHGANVESIKWSRTAGCSCGCSPGYQVKLKPAQGFGSTTSDPAYGKSFWVKVALEPIAKHVINKVVTKAIMDETNNPTPDRKKP